MTWWPLLSAEVELEFMVAQRQPRRKMVVALEERLWRLWQKKLEHDAFRYTSHRALRDRWYTRKLEMVAEYRQTSQLAHARKIQKSQRNQLARAQAVSGVACKLCGEPVIRRDRGFGPRPVFCSRRCSHRAAGKAYWRRHHGKG